MKLTSKPLAVIVLAIMFGGIMLSTALGWWQTEGSRQPARIKEGEFSGQPNPADIRGSYSFGDINTAFGIPLEELGTAFGLPQGTDVASFQIKSLEEMYAELPTEIGTSSVRLFVAWYTGLPYDFVEEIYLLEPAVEILQQKASLTEEQIAYLEAHTVVLEDVQAQTTPEAVTPSTTEEVVPTPTLEHSESEERIVKGKTTFQEVLDWGVPQAKIEEILGMAMPNPLTRVQDFCLQNGLSFSKVKPALQAEIDLIKP